MEQSPQKASQRKIKPIGDRFYTDETGYDFIWSIQKKYPANPTPVQLAQLRVDIMSAFQKLRDENRLFDERGRLV